MIGDEAEVATAWERGLIPRVALDRLGIQVVFRGLPSDAGGPDYQDAYLVIDGKLRSGDVEFHARSSDWYAHRHDRNPAYNRVILHVVRINDCPVTHTASGAVVPVVTIDPTDRELIPRSCGRNVAQLTDAERRDRLRKAGLRRFSAIVDRFRADLTCQDADQVLYAAVCEAMGYASNRGAFRQLAGALPAHQLLDLPAADRFAALIAAAGLGSEAGGERQFDWRLARLRPANHPRRRIAGIATLMTRLGKSPTEEVLTTVSRAVRPTDLRSTFTARDEGETFIGTGRADELVASVILPFAAALGLDGVESLYTRCPAPPENRWTRHMRSLAGVSPRTAAEHQGMHYLYHRHCRLERPEGCLLCM